MVSESGERGEAGLELMQTDIREVSEEYGGFVESTVFNTDSEVEVKNNATNTPSESEAT